MPELPEVETIRRELQTAIRGRKITRVEVNLPKIVKLPAATFRRALVGATVVDVHRRAKLVLFHLSSGWTMIIHLKMSGQLIWRPTKGKLRVGGHPIPGGLDNLPNKYSHVVFAMSGGTLFFNDQRQFGFVKLVKTAELDAWLKHEGYGPEPLERTFTLELFEAILHRHGKKRVKPTLLDQTVVAGLGNIYADESLHFAKIRPMRRINTLTPVERRDLFRGIQHVLTLSLKHKGTSADQYVTTTGEPGRMISFLKVYGREGERCKRCGGTIKKIVLAGRGTHFCPQCQR